MNLIPLPAFQDNYPWMLHDGRRARVVEPADPQPVLACLQRDGLQLEAILVTHHHPDHAGGADALREATGAVILGCGRLFEGSPAQMPSSLDKLAALRGSTRVCCAREYTFGNLKIARVVEPRNAELIHSLQRCEALRTQAQPTLLSTIEQEKLTHPFLRTRIPRAAQAARPRQRHPAPRCGGLRRSPAVKNEFK